MSVVIGEAIVAAVGETLIDAGFVEGMGTDWGLVAFTKLTPAGRREVGLWPSPDIAADRLLAVSRRPSTMHPSGSPRAAPDGPLTPSRSGRWAPWGSNPQPAD